MKSRYALLCLLAFGIITISLSSCVKIQNKVLMKGTWELVNFKLDTASLNYMEVILTDFNKPGNNPRYLIDFMDNDIATGTYFLLDTIHQIDFGTWSLDDKNMLQIQLGDYVDGLYEIDRQNRKNYVLTTDSNTARIGPTMFVSPVQMDIKRLF